MDMKLLATVKKECLEILHDRTMLGVLIVFPIFIMLLMGSSFRTVEIKGLPIAIVGVGNGSFSDSIVTELGTSKAFNLINVASEADAAQALRDGKVKAVIVFPPTLDTDISNGKGGNIKLLLDNSDLTLEQTMISALSSLIRASSANITRTYVNSAWDDLHQLNSSAAGLAGKISMSQSRMQNTSAQLSQIRSNISSLDIRSLANTLDKMALQTAAMQSMINEQSTRLDDINLGNVRFLNASDTFLQSADNALATSLQTVQDTHAKLERQMTELNNTIRTLDNSIIGLNLIRGQATNSSCGTLSGAIDLNIASLSALRNNAASQLNDAKTQREELENVNASLTNASASLALYRSQINNARSQNGDIIMMRASLASASESLSRMNASLASARGFVTGLEGLLREIGTTLDMSERTLGDARDQARDAETLITTLNGVVAKQTGKNPATIAEPLGVTTESTYTRTSYVDFIMPQVIAVSLLLSCVLFAAILFVRERLEKTAIRLLLIPGALGSAVLGKIITIIIISLGQVGIIVAFGTLFFGVQAPSNISAVVLATIVSSAVLASLGIVIGFFSKTESAAIQMGLLIAIPMLFLGNILFSPDLLPNYTQVLQQVLPLAHVTNLFKVVLITNGNPAGDIAGLLAYLALLGFLITYLVMKKKDISEF